MIEFFTFFLGLTSGVQTVELVVLEPVAEVELRLDGHSLGTVYGEPWSFDCDLGDALTPHELIAIGRDRDGREIDRIHQRINLPEPLEEELDDAEALPVPELSPVTVALEPGTELPATEAMDSWFLVDGEPAIVAAVERGSAEVAIVRDPAVQPYLYVIADSFYEVKRAFLQPTFKGAPSESVAWSEGWIDLDPDEIASPYRSRVIAAAQTSLRQTAVLGPGVEIRFLSPWAAPLSHVQSNRKLFAVSDRIRIGPRLVGHKGHTKGFLEITNEVSSLPLAFRLADAVALVAAQLHDSTRRRAIVVLLGDEAEESLFTPTQVRAFLRRLQIPIFIWSMASNDEPHPEWGEVHHVGFSPKSDRSTWADGFKDAANKLKQDLASQRIVWLQGRHLPQSIKLGEAARGLHLAGEPGESP